MGEKPGKDNMKALYINAADRKVEEIEIENKLEAFNGKIGCEMIQPLGLGGKFVILVDEEGKLRNWKAGFLLGDAEAIAGNALIVSEGISRTAGCPPV